MGEPPSAEQPSKPQNEFEREERRLVILLGLLGIAVGLKIAPAGTVPQIWTSPILDGLSVTDFLIVFWVVYALLMMIYFSDDLFIPIVRRYCKGIGLVFLYLYPTLLIFSVVYTAGLKIIPTDPAWEFILYFYGLIIIYAGGITASTSYFFRKILPMMQGKTVTSESDPTKKTDTNKDAIVEDSVKI